MRTTAEYYDDLDEPQLKGQATEAHLKAAFVKRGFSLLEPAYDNEQYDFVIERQGLFYRVQAKTARLLDTGTIQFETVSTKSRSDGYVRDDYAGAIDYFAVYSPDVDRSYLVYIEDAARGKMEIRVEPPKNNQMAGINWHEDYALDAVLAEGLRQYD